ncbi:major facilitator superfamily domain-containing protein 10-like [Dendronephthya gigantea]|uniref:major facilitator superfamily domain-containing protein 10-like n=1 Tax=Dendronephthya gigantea TaxID=151771 RepID=UPI00106AEC55|nr:major facilitator superfamily domain-containing protein 10-like [Dendronephthya gigantea]
MSVSKRNQSLKEDMKNGSAVHSSGKEVNNNLLDQKSSFRVMLVVFIGLLMDLMAFAVILPLLPSLLDHYSKDKEDGLYKFFLTNVNRFRDFLNIPNTERYNFVLFGGFVGSLFSFLQFLASPVLGALSDVYGRKSILLFSMVGVGISYGIWAYSRNFTIFVLARIIGGLCKGNVTISTAIVTDVTSMRNRGKGMALIGVAYSVGFIVGPVIGAIFSKQSESSSGTLYVLPAIFTLTVVSADILFLTCFLKETLPKDKRANSLTSEMKSALQLINPVSLFKFDAVNLPAETDLNEVKRVGLVYFLYLFFFSGLEFTLTFLTHSVFQYSSMQQGKMFFAMGIIMALVQGGYVRRIAPGGEKKLASRGIIALIPAMVFLGTAGSMKLFYCGIVLFAFGAATVVSALTTIVSKYGDTTQKGKIMGIFRSLGALARATGPFFSCAIYWSIGPMFCYGIGASFFVIPLYLLKKCNLSQKHA